MNRNTTRVKIPEALTLLCRMMDITPRHLLESFARDITLEGVAEASGYKESEIAVSYFIRCTEKHTRHSQQMIQEMFEELVTLREQWPGGSDREKEKRYRVYRKSFLKMWRRKWQQSQ